MEALSNPDEANKINRMRKELSLSNNLTQAGDDCHLFEMATNKHFNDQMNMSQYAESRNEP